MTPQPGVSRGAPTPNPTSTPISTPSEDSSTGLGTRSESVHVIASGDVAGLQNAITESNQNPTTLYKIYLEAGDYPLAQTLVIFGTVEIYGAHADTTILRQVGLPGSQTGSMNTMIKVPGISLTLDHLTLRDGYSYYAGGAIALENEAATLTATNARFLNNRVHQPPADGGLGMGGAIYPGGTLSLEKVYFRDNIAPFGGAVASYAPPNGGYRGILKYVDFKDNFGTSNAGAVYVGVGKGDVKIRQSNFRRNASNVLPPAAIPQHAFSHTPEIGIINAKKNFWNNPTVPSSATNEYGVNTLKQLASKVNFEFDPPAIVPPCGARGRQLCSPTPTPSATSSPVPQYAVVMGHQSGASWTTIELNAIDDAVSSVGESFHILFARMLIPTGSPQEAFNRVLVSGDSPNYVYLYKINSLTGVLTVEYPEGLNKESFTYPRNLPHGQCVAINNNGLPRTIACNWGTAAPYPEHAIIHELGHTFTNRSIDSVSTNQSERDNGLLYSAIQGTFSGSCTPTFSPAPPAPNPFSNMQFPVSSCSSINDANGSNGLVMGVSVITELWARGERGWGSGPDNIFTPFQMHPPDFSDFLADEDLTRVDETAADMFLNWVKRTVTDNPPTIQNPAQVPGSWEGFLNYSWAGNAANPASDNAFPGDARYEWMDRVMTRIFSVKNW